MAPAAQAAPEFFADTQLASAGADVNIVNNTGSFSPISDSNGFTGAAGGAAVSGSFTDIAAPGVLGSISKVTAAAGTGSHIDGAASADVEFDLDNIVFTGPVAPGTAVRYTINFGVSGSIGLLATGGSSAAANVSVRYAPNFFSLGTGITQLGTMFASVGPGAPGFSASGIFNAATGTGPTAVDGTTPAENAIVGSDVVAAFSLLTSVALEALPSNADTVGTATAVSDFVDPFSLSTSGPVFNFFDPTTGDRLTGLTANSADGCIVGNRFLCGASTTSVAEPSALASFAAALAGLALFGGIWRRRREQGSRLYADRASI